MGRWRVTAVCSLLGLMSLLASNPNNDRANTAWYDQLPKCPCQNPDRAVIHVADGWAKDRGNIAKYHTGAAACFRSYPPITTDEGLSAQQCCYDRENNLITDGSGAGTPDKVSACSGEDKAGAMTTSILGAIGHYRKDVKPWNDLGAKEKHGARKSMEQV